MVASVPLNPCSDTPEGLNRIPGGSEDETGTPLKQVLKIPKCCEGLSGSKPTPERGLPGPGPGPGPGQTKNALGATKDN